jgi:hypothetical protein
MKLNQGLTLTHQCYGVHVKALMAFDSHAGKSHQNINRPWPYHATFHWHCIGWNDFHVFATKQISSAVVVEGRKQKKMSQRIPSQEDM